MLRLKEVLVVEGRYDKNTLSQVVDATIIETGGFSIFNDREKQRLLKRLAESRGLIILTDSDAAGFMIRNRLKGCIDPALIKHAYIPDIEGKEKRKSSPSKEGKLGVEGMRPEVLIEALRRAGASFQDEESASPIAQITKADMYKKGLSGGPGSAEKRKEFCRRLNLPERLSSTELLNVIQALMSREEFLQL